MGFGGPRLRGKSDKKGTTGVGGSFAVHLGLRPFGLNLACSTPTGTEALERRPGATRLDLRHSEHANADQSKAEQKPFALDLIKKRRTGHRVGPRSVRGAHKPGATARPGLSRWRREGRKQATASPHRAPCSALGSSTEKGERSDATQRDVFGVTRPFDFRPPF